MEYLHANTALMNKLLIPSKSFLAMLSGPALFFLVLFINPFTLDPLANRVLATAVLMIAWWVTEAIPMPAVAIILSLVGYFQNQ